MLKRLLMFFHVCFCFASLSFAAMQPSAPSKEATCGVDDGGGDRWLAPGGLKAHLEPRDPGISDASVLDKSGLLLPCFMDTAGNEFTLSIQGKVPVTHAKANYEKAPVYCRVSTQDPSDYALGLTKDSVCIEAQASILPGNLTGRAWSYDAITSVAKGADGYAVGMELGLQNDGSDESQTGLPTSKNGIHLVGGGAFGGTAGIVLSGRWHDAFVCSAGAVTADCIRVLKGGTTTAQITSSGTARFASFGALGGGDSTATFTNFCQDTNGTATHGGCLYGTNNNVHAQYAVVAGKNVSDRDEYGSASFGSGGFGHGQGDSEWNFRILSGVIPAGGGKIRLSSQAGIIETATTIPIGSNVGLSLDCKMLVHSFEGQNTSNWSLDDALFDEGATPSTARMIGSPSWVRKYTSIGAADKIHPSVSADTELGSIDISVEAKDGGPWDVTARCFATESR